MTADTPTNPGSPLATWREGFDRWYAQSGTPRVVARGRYDALTAVLGQGRSIPAVGGVIRPGLVARLKGTA